MIKNLHIHTAVASSGQCCQHLVVRKFISGNAQSPTRISCAFNETGDRFGCATREPCERSRSYLVGPFVAEQPRVLLRRSSAAIEMDMMRSAVFALGSDTNG